MSNYLSRKDHSLLQSFQVAFTDLFSSISKILLNKYPLGDLMHQEINRWAAALFLLTQTLLFPAGTSLHESLHGSVLET